MWHVKIHDDVGKEDFKTISPADRQRIIDTAIEKLSKDPYAYGHPLHSPYKGYWRLRFDKYRVVYQIIKEDVMVWIIMIGKRKDNLVYRKLASRLFKIHRN